jgi:hypothetical protein
MQPVLGIELDDSSHQRADRIERDEFVTRVFEAAGLPLLHIPARASYSVQDLAQLIAPHLTNQAEDNQSAPHTEDASAANHGRDEPPLCPRCQVPMVLRTATRGDHAGQQFYGCPNYPKCKETRQAAAAPSALANSA